MSTVSQPASLSPHCISPHCILESPSYCLHQLPVVLRGAGHYVTQRAPPSAWVRALAGTDSGLVVGHNSHSGPAVGASSGEVQLWQAVLLSHLALTAHSQGNRGWALLLLGRGGGQMPWSRRQMSDSSGLPHLPTRYICHLNFLPSRRNSLMPSVKNWTGDN